MGLNAIETNVSHTVYFKMAYVGIHRAQSRFSLPVFVALNFVMQSNVAQCARNSEKRILKKMEARMEVKIWLQEQKTVYFEGLALYRSRHISLHSNFYINKNIITFRNIRSCVFVPAINFEIVYFKHFFSLQNTSSFD